MKRITGTILSVVAFIMVLSACGVTAENESSESKIPVSEPEESAESKENKEKENQIDDQLDLVMGDTGHFDTVLGSFDMTLEAAELVDEIEDEKSTQDGFIILDLTIKNTGDEPISGEDIILSMEVTDNLEHSGSTDHAAGFDTMNEFEDDLQPGEEQSGHFLTIVDEADTYYFRKMVGNVASGSTNQVIWTIQADEKE